MRIGAVLGRIQGRMSWGLEACLICCVVGVITISIEKVAERLKWLCTISAMRSLTLSYLKGPEPYWLTKKKIPNLLAAAALHKESRTPDVGCHVHRWDCNCFSVTVRDLFEVATALSSFDVSLKWPVPGSISFCDLSDISPCQNKAQGRFMVGFTHELRLTQVQKFLIPLAFPFKSASGTKQ